MHTHRASSWYHEQPETFLLRQLKLPIQPKKCHLSNKIDSFIDIWSCITGLSDHSLKWILSYLCSITRRTKKFCLLHGCTTFLQPPLDLITSTNIGNTINWCHYCLLYQFPIHLDDAHISESTIILQDTSTNPPGLMTIYIPLITKCQLNSQGSVIYALIIPSE